MPKYEKLLAGGGSQSPQDLLKPLGVGGVPQNDAEKAWPAGHAGLDITDKAFWRKGFTVIEEMMVELEKS